MANYNKKDVGEYSQKCVSLLHISDIEGTYYEVFDSIQAEILIFTGNYCKMTQENHKDKTKELNEFFAKINCKHKLFLCGDEEDYLGQLSNEQIQKLLPNCILMHEKFIELEGIRFYGLPHMDFGPYSVSDEIHSDKLNDIPENTDVLLTHMPPLSILDLNGGNSVLREFFQHQIKPNIKLHCFGHVAGDTGFETLNSVVFSNAAMKIKKKPNLIHFYIQPNEKALNSELEIIQAKENIQIDVQPVKNEAPIEPPYPNQFLEFYSKLSNRVISPLWNWAFENGYIINDDTGYVVDIDSHKLTPGAIVIMWKKLTPRANQQLWKLDNEGHFVSDLNGFHLDCVPYGSIEKHSQFHDPKNPAVSAHYWDFQYTSLVNNPPTANASQKWKYHKESRLIQNLQNGYFLGLAQFSRFILFLPG